MLRPQLRVPAARRHLAVALATIALLPAAALAAGECGVPLSSSPPPKATDCLFVLRTAVQLETCPPCTCDVNNSGSVTATDALLCLRDAVGLEVTLECPACQATTTTTLVEGSGACPGSVSWTTHAEYGPTCTSNADCDAGACDAVSGRCRTASELDLGWTGRAHDIDPGEGSVLRVGVQCDGEGGGSGCGTCTIGGIDPTAGNCRCASDIHTACNAPFEADPAHCAACIGGALAGSGCTDNASCSGGPCDKHCAFDPEIVCAVNADCPTGRKRCDDVLRCGSGRGIACSANADCDGTCSGAADCVCYDGPPVPVASVDFPFCVLARFAGDVSGTVDVDTGQSRVVKNLKLLAYGGLSVPSPCPVCGGTCDNNHQKLCSADADCGVGGTCDLDPTPNDGSRGGVCVGGPDQGRPCDVQATSASFPARPGSPKGGGGGYSLDCAPAAGGSFTGAGLAVTDVETTGQVSLESNVPCNPEEPFAGDCPCLMCTGGSSQPCNTDEDCSASRNCSGWTQIGCTSNADCTDLDVGTCTTFNDTRCSGSFATVCTTNADCASADFGTCDPAKCASAGIGIFPEPNSCTGGQCTDDGNGEGHCTSGPDDRVCDALVTADGRGIHACLTNEDCSFATLGVDAGNCDLVQRRLCFPNPIVTSGSADPSEPLSAAAFCVPPTSGAGKNVSVGLPGPAQILRQTTLAAFCASDPLVRYTPGIGGCPP